MIPDRFTLLSDTTASCRGEAESSGVEVVKVAERPRAVAISIPGGTSRVWVMKAGLVRTGQPDIMALRPWVKIQGALRKLLEERAPVQSD